MVQCADFFPPITLHYDRSIPTVRSERPPRFQHLAQAHVPLRYLDLSSEEGTELANRFAESSEIASALLISRHETSPVRWEVGL